MCTDSPVFARTNASRPIKPVAAQGRYVDEPALLTGFLSLHRNERHPIVHVGGCQIDLHHHQQQQTTRDDVPRSVLLLTNSTPSQCPAFHRHRPVVTHLLTLQTTSSYARNHSLAASFDYCSLESCPFSASAIGPSLLRQNQALLSIHCTCRCLGHCSPTHCPEDR